MSSIKKVLCVKAKNEGTKLFTTGAIYDVINDSGINGGAAWVNDNLGRKTFIILSYPCIHGEWQPLEEYVCMTGMFAPMVKLGDIVTGYIDNGILKIPSDINSKQFSYVGGFKKLSEMPQKAKSYQRHEVRHVIYDTKDNKIVNDAMGECYITLAEAQEVCDEMNTPKVMKPKYTKEVEYFGVKILVPDDAKFIATTSRGSLLSCDSPMYQLGIEWSSNLSMISVIGFIDLNGIEWKDTLMEIK